MGDRGLWRAASALTNHPGTTQLQTCSGAAPCWEGSTRDLKWLMPESRADCCLLKLNMRLQGRAVFSSAAAAHL